MFGVLLGVGGEIQGTASSVAEWVRGPPWESFTVFAAGSSRQKPNIAPWKHGRFEMVRIVLLTASDSGAQCVGFFMILLGGFSMRRAYNLASEPPAGEKPPPEVMLTCEVGGEAHSEVGGQMWN